jgi:methyl-accepting chemotaxis protein-1 (serine sensor receptor)
VARVTDIMGEIAAASAEQSRGIDQVNLTITQMDETTQQNAALVEQAAAASKSLEAQGRELSDTVAAFRMPSGAHRASPGTHAQEADMRQWQPAGA